MSDLHLHLNMNSFDLIILSIVALSSVIAFFRGFLSELLSFGAWVGAAVFTIYLFPHSEAIMRQYVNSAKVAAGAGALITYFLALITISMINSVILKYAKNAQVGLLDNFLGLVFGVLRGLFIVSFIFLVISAVTPKSPPPEWMKTSITKDYLKKGADFIVSAAPKYMVDLEAVIRKQADHENNPQDAPPVDTGKDYKIKKTQDINNILR